MNALVAGTAVSDDVHPIMSSPEQSRKIVHVDMDCFYAAIELRERPELVGKPVAVGGTSGRGVLTTCNYEARKFGCHSAMPAFKAKRLCPDLVMLPVRFDLYRKESAHIREIFAEFTDLIEPLSLDEAYLDVSHLASEASSVAWEIRQRIRERTRLTASAGIAPNKFLAKIASDWEKPDGQFEVREGDILGFLEELPVGKIWGVGKRTAERLHEAGILTCGEMRKRSERELMQRFGKFGHNLYHLCRGMDDRSVNPNRERKSVSNERTFRENLTSVEEGLGKLGELVDELRDDYDSRHSDRIIRECVVKLKFEDFQITSAQRAAEAIDAGMFDELLAEAWERGEGRSVRLIGAGVRFRSMEKVDARQLEMFEK